MLGDALRALELLPALVATILVRRHGDFQRLPFPYTRERQGVTSRETSSHRLRLRHVYAERLLAVMLGQPAQIIEVWRGLRT